jgi:proton-translocating NADH-quinone oxidoreductase chain L
MLVLVLFLPLFSFFLAALFGRFLGKGACYISVLNLFLSFLISSFFFLKVIYLGVSYKFILFSWIHADSLNINWGFLFDSLTIIMLIVITFISFLVHLYSLEYMSEDPHLCRFMSYLSLFTFFMLILVSADNFLQMFVGWEGVGLSSYLLINFWYTRIQANKSAIKAMLVNRVGDFFILLGLFLVFLVFNTLDYDSIFLLCISMSTYYFSFSNFDFFILDFICLFLFLGAMGKSAQFGLHTWLPDAMEGPTPVSALIHAATMVTAGVFLLARCSFIFEVSTLILNFIIFIGCITAFFASTVGLFQNDIKKIIAYSTCSQLGYMIFSCGLSSYDVAVFHLYNHAFFKALLFLSAGSIIHGVFDEQDLRRLGGLQTRLPFSYSVMLIGSLSLVGFPFMSGFYSKDCILELAYAKHSVLGHFSYYFGVLAVFSTAFYSTRLLYLGFLSEVNGNKKTIIFAHEPGIYMLIPLVLLCFLSIFSGFLSKDLIIGFGSSFFSDTVFVSEKNYLGGDIEFIPVVAKLIPFFITLLSIFFCYLLYSFYTIPFYRIKMSKVYNFIFTFFNKKWYIDRIYNESISQNILSLGFDFFYKEIDRGFLEQVGPLGVVQLIKNSSSKIKTLRSGSVFHYIFIMYLFTLVLCFCMIFFFIIFYFLEMFLVFFILTVFYSDSVLFEF